jgi:hypothetical protein
MPMPVRMNPSAERRFVFLLLLVIQLVMTFALIQISPDLPCCKVTPSVS